MSDEIDLEMTEIDVQTFAEGNALGCFFSAATASTASCPGSSAATLTTASTLG